MGLRGFLLCDSDQVFLGAALVDESRQLAEVILFHQVTPDRPEELACLFGGARREVNAQHPRIVKTKIDLLAIWHLHHQKMTEVLAQFLQWLVTGQVNTPVLAPAL